VSRLNAAGGRPVEVSSDTLELVELAIEGWSLTDGCFDPTILPALTAAGYDVPFGSVIGRAAGPAHVVAAAAPGPTCIRTDRRASTVTLPPGVQFDPGGIGKGFAADLVAAELIDRGADGVCVNVAGDVRVAGSPPPDRRWEVAVEDPHDPRSELARLVVADAGVCTSSTLIRRWKAGGRRFHHLIDPSTGSPTRTDLVAATVVAPRAWLAEVLTKVLFVRGVDVGAPLVSGLGATGIAVRHDGTVLALPRIEEVLPCS
jgi:thiamine biosynthesis lipoprotein